MKIFLEQLTQNPKTYLNNLCEENRLSQAFLGYSLGIISLYFAIKLNSFTLPTLSSFITTFIFWFICNITANFILAATANLFLDFFGYKSKALGIFILLGISQLIWTLLVPCFLIKKAFPQTAIFTPLFVLAVFFFQIYAVLSWMKKTFRTSKIASFLAFGFSFVFPVIAGFTLLFFLISFLTALFG